MSGKVSTDDSIFVELKEKGLCHLKFGNLCLNNELIVARRVVSAEEFTL